MSMKQNDYIRKLIKQIDYLLQELANLSTDGKYLVIDLRFDNDITFIRKVYTKQYPDSGGPGLNEIPMSG